MATLLAGGDRRSIGRSDHVAAVVRGKPELFPELITGLWSKNPVIRMRTADAVEKVTRKKPELLTPYKKELLGLMAEAKDARIALAFGSHGSAAPAQLAGTTACRIHIGTLSRGSQLDR